MTVEAYHAGQTTRYHTNPVIARLGQNNAEHQWGCVLLLLLLHPDPSLELIQATAVHDVGEIRTGDMSYPAKRKDPDLARRIAAIEKAALIEFGLDYSTFLIDEDRKWMELVDRLESYLYVQLHLPHALERNGWPEVRERILAMATCLRVGLEVQQLIEGE